MQEANQTKETCYACNALATGAEHIPPKCIFPNDSAYRCNLIKVPSCDKHNSMKSKDDELLRHVLVTAPENNKLAIKVLEDSVLPSFERRPHIVKTFFHKLTPINTGGMETAWYSIDLKRFQRSIRQIVRGLYFFTYEQKLHADLYVVWGALRTPDQLSAPFYDITKKGEKILPPIDSGANPKVFRYNFTFSRDKKTSLCRLQFYDGIPVLVTWRDSGATV